MDHSKPSSKAIQLVQSDVNEAPAVECGRSLLELSATMDKANVFQKGQLVKWKAGLKNRKWPAYNEVAVVRDVLTDPVFDDCEHGKCAGSPMFREPLTLVLGAFDSDHDFFEMHYDSRRMEPAWD